MHLRTASFCPVLRVARGKWRTSGRFRRWRSNIYEFFPEDNLVFGCGEYEKMFKEREKVQTNSFPRQAETYSTIVYRARDQLHHVFQVPSNSCSGSGSYTGRCACECPFECSVCPKAFRLGYVLKNRLWTNTIVYNPADARRAMTHSVISVRYIYKAAQFTREKL